MAACLAQKDGAYETLIERYKTLIFSIPIRMGLPEEEAADVFQQVCISLFTHLENLRDSRRLVGWLISMTRNEVLQRHRKRVAMPLSDLAAGEQLLESLESQGFGRATSPSPEETVIALEEQHMVYQAMMRLPERCRDLLLLLYGQETPSSYAETGRRLGIPFNSVSPNRTRCLQHLKKILEDMDF